jgi:hypothetical protein
MLARSAGEMVVLGFFTAFTAFYASKGIKQLVEAT